MDEELPDYLHTARLLEASDLCSESRVRASLKRRLSEAARAKLGPAKPPGN